MRWSPQSFKSILEITTNGKTSGRLPVKLTPAEIQAKKNALNALKETLPASLYPCIAVAAGTTLLAPTVLGIAVGGTLVAASKNVCQAYYSTIMTELSTVKDPPRGDYSVLAPAPRGRVAAVPKECASSSGAVRKACVTAAAASAKLLGDARSTESAAKAISTTIAREVGAQHAGNRAAAARQDGHLKALGKVFAVRRRTEIAAGDALAKLFGQANAALRLSAAQSANAKSVVLAGLAARGTPSSHIALARRLLHGGALNVLRTLGR